jgi:gliding-associated putative ABC transporter substrate-binding component GldG
MMKQSKNMDKSILVLAVIGSLIAVNVLALEFFARADLTRDGQFTLSEATVKTLEELPDPVRIEAYFTENLPPPYGNNARYVRDLLEEYFARNSSDFSFQFIDPASSKSDADKEKKKNVQKDIFGRTVREATELETKLQELGIPPVELRVNEDDKLEIKRIFMGLAVHYGDQTEVIPVVQNTGNLEYELTTIIRKLVRPRIPKVAFLVGHDGPDPKKEMGRLWGVLGQLYDLSELDLRQAPMMEDLDALIVAGPKSALGAEELNQIDQFITGGGSAAFLLDAISVDQQTLQTEPKTHGLQGLLSRYGVVPSSKLVLDKTCSTINVMRQQGYMRVAQQVAYPFMPVSEDLDKEHPLTRGLGQVALPFVSPLVIEESKAGHQVDVLVRSSKESWLADAPFNMDPFQRWTLDALGKQSAHPLVAVVKLKQTSTRQSRVLVAGSSSFLTDQFMQPSNEALVLNLMDWLVLDEDLLAVRTRGLAAAPLDELEDSQRLTVKYANIVGLPVLFMLFGLVRWRRREARRLKAQF